MAITFLKALIAGSTDYGLYKAGYNLAIDVVAVVVDRYGSS